MIDAGNEKKIVNILWTGGYDSTFRVVQLSKLPIKIKPYYISDNRYSEKAELHAIKKVIDELKNKQDIVCTFLDLETIPINERVVDPNIEMAFKNLLSLDFMGSQYEWLSYFAKIHPGIELSIHQDDKAVILINKHGAFTRICDPVLGDYFVIDEANSHKDIVTLFGNFHFPLLEYTKVMMKEEYARLGCEDIINLTWFCYSPVNGQSCGLCNPCIYTIEEGLYWRFSATALKRYKYRTIYKPFFKVYHYCRKIFKMK